jgi:dienelactone hydrolase
MRWALLILCLLPGCAAAPDGLELPPPDPNRGEQVLDLLEARARDVLAGIDHPTDRATWEKETPRLRKQLLASLGLARLPKPQPSKLRSVGTIDRGDYRIDKLVYETLPGVEVPAHLYRPATAAGKGPAILFVPGHWWADSKTKTDFQAFCITMARRGFVVLTYDPFGQGERGISQRDHRRTELLAVGVAQQAIVDFESLCALELLLARPDVDASRIGMTGASGGGYNSWIVPSIDPRIAVSVPVVGTSEFLEQLSAVRERDWYDAKEHCHFVPGLLRYANNHEFVAMLAPRPLLIIAAHNDHSFRIPGNRAVAEYGARLYHALGAPERVRYVEDETEGHGYQKKKREAAYGWFLKWLKGEGDGGPLAEPPTETPPWDAPDLRCFPPGENRPAGPGLVALAKSLAAPPPKPDPSQLAQALGIPLQPRLTASSKLQRGPGSRVSWVGRDGLEIPGVLIPPSGAWTGAVLAAADTGKESLREQPELQAALRSGQALLLADIRGTGELATGKPGWTFAVSLLLGENFVGRQAMDLVAGWRALRALPELAGKPVRVFGSGPFMAQAALYAAVLEPRVSEFRSVGGFRSYADFVDRSATESASYTLARPGEEKTVRIDTELPAALIPFDVLRRFDLPDLAASIGARPAGMQNFSLPNTNPSEIRGSATLPARVHAVEDFETDIEQRWWMAGKLETENVPPGSRRACRGTLANDFDDLMGDPAKLYTAVIFNPVPGPPMGKNTRLKFRYWLKGSDRLRVQLYSLSKGYHRHLTLNGLPQGSWQTGVVDMTAMRRPDGSGGPLSDGERIDDIQFYADASSELIIDDIVLYEAAGPDEARPFPSHVVFAAGFDTGRQGKDWPGDFEIVPHEPPRTWKAARSISDPSGEGSGLRISLRGRRPLLGGELYMRFSFRLTEGAWFEVALGAGPWVRMPVSMNSWNVCWGTIDRGLAEVSEIRFRAPGKGVLWIDDLLLYEP